MSALVGVVNMVVGVTFAALRQKYSSDNGQESEDLFIYQNSSLQQECGAGC